MKLSDLALCQIDTAHFFFTGETIGEREMPKGGLPLITRWVFPLHRLLVLLGQVLLSTKGAW
jgi:hypothetical protein